MADSIKDRDTYEALKDQGMASGKAAAIANARANGTLDPDGRAHEDPHRRGAPRHGAERATSTGARR